MSVSFSQFKEKWINSDSFNLPVIKNINSSFRLNS
jgi:hypothetical protein